MRLVLALFACLAVADRPNILFAIADDWSYGHAGAYGCEWVKTPGFDRVATEGLLFQRSYTPNAKCAPSRAIILTGRNSWQLEHAGNHMAIFPAKFGGYVETLAANGYSCGFTGKGWGPGFAHDAKGKPRAITGKRYAQHKAKPRARAISHTDYAKNFEAFLADAGDGPWAFWLGTTEPHRGYEYGSGQRLGKKLSDIEHVPAFWPDNESIRNDMLDYAVEVEHFDTHLKRALELLDAKGLAENTLVVATSDHGMPFPRCKGQAYDYSNHIPLAMRWPKGITGKGRVVKDYVSHADFAPTFLKAAGIDDPAPIMQPITGRHLFDIFESEISGQVNPSRDHVLIGKERHDIGRPNSGGYPIRGIVTDNRIFLMNFETDRWPSGNPETGYLNCDGSPTKTAILNARRSKGSDTHWDLCFGKRPAEELYDVSADPDCVKNLAKQEQLQTLKAELRARLVARLKDEGDPRMFGKGEIFDNYPYSGKSTDNFYERYKAGNMPKAGWVKKSDFEPAPLD